jgi:hypothetical protein
VADTFVRRSRRSRCAAGFFVLVLYRVYFSHSFFARAFRGLNVSSSSSTALSFRTP